MTKRRYGRRTIGMSLVLVGLCLTATSCATTATMPLLEPDGLPDRPLVQLRYADLPSVLAPFAVHSWLATWDPEEGRWHRWEVWQSAGAGPGDFAHVRRDLFSRPDAFLGSGGESWVGAEWHGEEATRLIETLRAEAPHYAYKDSYLAWPGPNCNTFTAEMIRAAGVGGADMHPRAVGKDFVGLGGAGVGLSPSGSGVQAETPLLGLKLGLADGIELHVLCLTFGVDFWPPAIKTPLGRLGFAEHTDDADEPAKDVAPETGDAPAP